MPPLGNPEALDAAELLLRRHRATLTFILYPRFGQQELPRSAGQASTKRRNYGRSDHDMVEQKTKPVVKQNEIGRNEFSNDLKCNWIAPKAPGDDRSADRHSPLPLAKGLSWSSRADVLGQQSAAPARAVGSSPKHPMPSWM
jgi:hypothetical protein